VRWLQARALRERKIAAADMDLIILTDDPQQAVAAVLDAQKVQDRVAAARIRGDREKKGTAGFTPGVPE
jgi:hypothetical protein